MKQLAKKLARRAGFMVTTAGHSGARYVEHPPRGPFDEVILRLFPDPRGLNFIQIGANDGVRGDPIRKYVGECGWTGVLVEPEPSLCSQLRANYEPHHSRLQFINAALDAGPGHRDLHRIDPLTPGVVDWARGVISFDREHVLAVASQVGLPPTAVVPVPVRCCTWDEVRTVFGPRHCDVLVIDTEGYDVRLLRLANLARMKPSVIQFEHGCLSREVRLEFYGELLDLGYELATSFIDTVAYLNAPPAAPRPAA